MTFEIGQTYSIATYTTERAEYVGDEYENTDSWVRWCVEKSYHECTPQTAEHIELMEEYDLDRLYFECVLDYDSGRGGNFEFEGDFGEVDAYELDQSDWETVEVFVEKRREWEE